jgi:hypothetical protein
VLEKQNMIATDTSEETESLEENAVKNSLEEIEALTQKVSDAPSDGGTSELPSIRLTEAIVAPVVTESEGY